MVDILNPTPSAAGTVKHNDELRRIMALPRRLWDDDPDYLTKILKTPQGTMGLRQIQHVALTEIGMVGGLFGPLRVGAGKTLISLLAPVVGFAARPLLLVPASLVGKTERDSTLLRVHWDLPSHIRIMSYEWLGRVQAAEALEEYHPDQIVADEVHRLKNPRAACTRRVRRFMAEHPSTKFVAMSGTITKRSIKDYAHIIRWCIKGTACPLPQWHGDLELWADALDERKGQTKRANPGALRALCNEEEDKLWTEEPRRAARMAYRRRLVETPGVVATKSTPIDASIRVSSVEPPVTSAIDDAFATLRDMWETPDGWPISDGLSMFRHARELALGFFYIWSPRPPAPWLEARRAWCSFVRKILGHSRKLDSELQVRREHGDSPECRAWVEIRDSFKPNTEPRWLDASIVKYCASWAKENNGIVWTEHRCFGELLQSLGVPYYGRKGLDARGNMIEEHPAGQGLAASIPSNSTGRNLQAWSKNLIVSMPANGLQTEQLMGRTHRDGQPADEVTFEIITSCAEHVGSFLASRAGCTVRF